MIRSLIDEYDEFDLIREPDHVARVWARIEGSLPRYWDLFIEREREALAAARSRGKARGAPIDASERGVLDRIFSAALASYEREAEKYRQFIDEDALEEYYDDPNAFKQGLGRDVPVIANTLRGRHAELKEWQMHFRMAGASDLLEVFSNLLEFATDWSRRFSTHRYAEIDDVDDFELDPVDDDSAMHMAKVVGTGIKSIVLHHLDPERFPPRGRNALYALYFLSGRGHFDLPTESSEFLMVNDLDPASDGSLICDQNYWYPYALFTLYALRIYRWLDSKVSERGYTFDPSRRYVYVERFLHGICDIHSDDLATMRAYERFSIPG